MKNLILILLLLPILCFNVSKIEDIQSDKEVVLKYKSIDSEIKDLTQKGKKSRVKAYSKKRECPSTQCTAKKLNGERCKNTTTSCSKLCDTHD